MKTLLSIILLPLVALSTLVTVWLADRDRPIALNNVWVEPTVVEACKSVQVWIDRDAYRQTGLTIELILSNAMRQSSIPINTDTKELRGPLGNYSYGVDMEVPCTFRPGWATVKRKVYYFRNPIQEYVWPIRGDDWVVPVCIIAGGQQPEEVCKKSERPAQGR